jgi:chromosome segregation ATPase
LSASRRASVLDHENRLLRARLEGRGRIEADPELRRRLAAATSENERLRNELDQARRNLDHSRGQEAELRRRLQGQTRQVANLGDRLAAMGEQLKGHDGRMQQLSRQIGEVQRLHHDAGQRTDVENELREATRRIELLESELDTSRSELAQARSDLGRMLLRLRSTPLIHLFRRWSGFRVIEARWSGR